MNKQEQMLRRIRSCQFAMWELHIFLDTHPNDCKAAKKLEDYQKLTADLTSKYESEYGPLNETAKNTSRWAWVSDPWPWENVKEDKK